MISSDKENALQTTKESDTLCLYIITIFHFPFFRTMDKFHLLVSKEDNGKWPFSDKRQITRLRRADNPSSESVKIDAKTDSQLECPSKIKTVPFSN